MNEQEKKELEDMVRQLIVRNRKKPALSQAHRHRAIMQRSLFELGFKDLRRFSAVLMQAMWHFLVLPIKILVAKK